MSLTSKIFARDFLKKLGNYAVLSLFLFMIIHLLPGIGTVSTQVPLAREQQGGHPMNLIITSSAFSHGQEIPRRFTCDGGDISPPLNFDGQPSGTKSLALIVDDPDAPDPKAPRMTWVHWVLYNIPVAVNGLPEGGSKALPAGILEGMNDWRRTGYGGPCPPIGRHRYFHKLYALDIVLPDLGRPDKARLEKEMQGHIIEQAELVGLYERSR